MRITDNPMSYPIALAFLVKGFEKEYLSKNAM